MNKYLLLTIYENYVKQKLLKTFIIHSNINRQD